MSYVMTANQIAGYAGLVAEPTRAAMVMALMDGRALSAGELAKAAGITAQTASGHLGRLVEGGMLRVHVQGRHRYYALATPEIADFIERLGTLASAKTHIATGPRAAELRLARRCYDHLAGYMGIEVYDGLMAAGHLVLQDSVPLLSEKGRQFFCDFGVTPEGGGRPLCRHCLDWSERRFHLGGVLGARLLDRFLALKWLRPMASSRALALTDAGQRGFRAHFSTDGA